MAEPREYSRQRDGCALGTAGLGCTASVFGFGLGMLGVVMGALGSSEPLEVRLLFIGAAVLSLIIGVACMALWQCVKAGETDRSRVALITVLVSALTMWVLTWGVIGVSFLQSVSTGGGMAMGGLVFIAPPLLFPPAVAGAAGYTLLHWRRSDAERN